MRKNRVSSRALSNSVAEKRQNIPLITKPNRFLLNQEKRMLNGNVPDLKLEKVMIPTFEERPAGSLLYEFCKRKPRHLSVT